MRGKVWISVGSLLLLGLLVWISWSEILYAWELLASVNLWILSLLIPVQIISYYAVGAMIFSYLKQKGSVKKVHSLSNARIALELNFVNHILPTGGLSGIAYTNWRLKQFGVRSGRATMAQVVRHAVGGAAFAAILLLGVFLITIDGSVNRWILTFSSLLVGALVVIGVLIIFLLSSRTRVQRFSRRMRIMINKTVRFLTFGKRQQIITQARIQEFFEELHEDYIALSKEKKLLIRPFVWGLVFVASDVLMFMISFWALGYSVNFAVMVIAYGLAVTAGAIAFTPGGSGAYEAVMVAFLAVAGVTAGAAIAATLLARIVLVLGTVVFGYIFYQDTLLRNGGRSDTSP